MPDPNQSLTARLQHHKAEGTEPVEIRVVAHVTPHVRDWLRRRTDRVARYLERHPGWFSVEFRRMTDTEAAEYRQVIHERMVDELDDED